VTTTGPRDPDPAERVLPPEGKHLLVGDQSTGQWWEITREGRRRLIGSSPTLHQHVAKWMTWNEDGVYTGEAMVVRMAEHGEIARYPVEEDE
jgi:hypothetical protein